MRPFVRIDIWVVESKQLRLSGVFVRAGRTSPVQPLISDYFSV
jgi:hypothetical protein